MKYITKRIRQQVLYWKILTGVMFLSVIVMGAVGTWTNKVLGVEPSTVNVPRAIVVQEETVEQQIRRIAKEENFQWTDYLVNLARCESRLNPYATNGNGNKPAGSVDRGLFQYNSYWQKGVTDECAFDIQCSTKKTIELINQGKQHLWACNKIVLSK